MQRNGYNRTSLTCCSLAVATQVQVRFFLYWRKKERKKTQETTVARLSILRFWVLTQSKFSNMVRRYGSQLAFLCSSEENGSFLEAQTLTARSTAGLCHFFFLHFSSYKKTSLGLVRLAFNPCGLNEIGWVWISNKSNFLSIFSNLIQSICIENNRTSPYNVWWD
jgi:hypothetical protein